MRPPVCSPRHFDFEHEGKKRPVGRRDQPPSVFRLAEFGDEGNGRSARVRLREPPEHCARPLAGAICQVEEPVALVAGAAELWCGEGQPCRRRRDRAPIGGSPRIKSGGGHASFKEIFPDMNRLPASTAPRGGGVRGSGLTAHATSPIGTRVSGRPYISRCGAFVTPFQSNSAVFDTGAGRAFLSWHGETSRRRSVQRGRSQGGGVNESPAGSRIPASGQRRRQWIRGTR